MDYKAGKRFFFPRYEGFAVTGLPALLMVLGVFLFLFFFPIISFVASVTFFSLDRSEDLLSALGAFLLYTVLPLVCSALPVAAGIFLAVLKRKPISPGEYETAVKAYPADFTARASRHLSFPENNPPTHTLLAESYRYEDTAASHFQDGVVYTDVYEKTALFLTETHLCRYTLRFRTTRKEEEESAEVLAYDRILSVTLTETPGTLRRASVCLRYIELTLTDGRTLKIPCKDRDAAKDICRILTEKTGKKEGSR